MIDFASLSMMFDGLWADMQQPGFWVSVFQIIWIDILLAGDNAVVIALACRNLPPHLRGWGMGLGAGVAVLMRIGFTFIVATLMMVPFLKLVGGLLLFYIAIKLLLPEEVEEEKEIHSSEKLWHAVRIVALADIVMSLDNVLAIAAAAKGHTFLYVFGLAASVPLIVAGAALVMSILTRFPILVWAGAGLLGWIAGELIATDPVIAELAADLFGSGLQHSIALAAAAVGVLTVIGLGWALRRRQMSSAV